MPESTGALADRTTEATVAPSLAARSSGFRPDIQAMRALAVGVVVLYHLWPERFPGGFIGVDVFFVISGYLITQHLMQEVARTGRISLTQFWARRIRRLLPAAFLVLGFSLVVLLVVMPPVTWGPNLEEIRASAAYVENWLLGFHAIDYLAAENSASLVQHYWSLAVEEQFYLLWPLLILAAVAVGRSSQPEQRVRRVRWVLAGVFLVSLALSIAATPKDPALAFFATPLRAWEFAAGGLLVMFVRQASQIDVRLRAALSWFGWIVIIGATLFMQGSHVQFPGWIALVPVVAAVCCLAAGDPSTRWAPGRLIRNQAVQWTGARSYSIYLWHWPLIIAAPWVLGRSLTSPVKVVLLVLTVLLAWATKRWVEDPVRTGAWWRAQRRRAYGFAIAGTVLLVGLTTVWIQQLDATWTDKDRQSLATLQSGDSCYAAGALINGCANPYQRPADMDIAFAATDFDPVMKRCQQPVAGDNPVFCYYGAGEGAEHTIAVVGNSHALRLIPALDLYGRTHNWRVILAAKTDCMGLVVPGLDSSATRSCQGWSENVRDALFTTGGVDAVVLASHLSSGIYLGGPNATADDMAKVDAGVVATFEDYRQHGIKVMVTGDVPGTRPVDAPSCVAASAADVDPCARPRAGADVSNTLVDIARAHPELVTYVPMSDFMCDATTCHAVEGGVVVYSDSHHLTTAFSRSLAPYLGADVEQLLGSQ